MGNKTKMKSVAPSKEAVAFREEVVALLQKHKAMTGWEMLAVSAHMVGQILAMQDQRTVTKDAAMQLIGENIERGNAEVIDELLNNTSGRA